MWSTFRIFKYLKRTFYLEKYWDINPHETSLYLSISENKLYSVSIHIWVYFDLCEGEFSCSCTGPKVLRMGFLLSTMEALLVCVVLERGLRPPGAFCAPDTCVTPVYRSLCYEGFLGRS